MDEDAIRAKRMLFCEICGDDFFRWMNYPYQKLEKMGFEALCRKCLIQELRPNLHYGITMNGYIGIGLAIFLVFFYHWFTTTKYGIG